MSSAQRYATEVALTQARDSGKTDRKHVAMENQGVQFDCPGLRVLFHAPDRGVARR
jgi:hypothetical protein